MWPFCVDYVLVKAESKAEAVKKAIESFDVMEKIELYNTTGVLMEEAPKN